MTDFKVGDIVFIENPSMLDELSKERLRWVGVIKKFHGTTNLIVIVCKNDLGILKERDQYETIVTRGQCVQIEDAEIDGMNLGLKTLLEMLEGE